MLYDLWLALFIVSAVFTLAVTYPRERGQPGFWREMQRRAGSANARFGNRVRRLWGQHVDASLQAAGMPKGWTTQRVNIISLGFGGAFVVFGGIAVIEGGNAGILVLATMFAMMYAWVAPSFVLRSVAARNRVAEIQEIIQLLQTLEVYLLNHHPIRDALEVSAESLEHLGPRVRKALMTWGQGSYRAIEQLRGPLDDDAMRLAIAAIQQAIDIGEDQLPVFLAREQQAVSKSREAAARASQARKPVIYTMFLALPVASIITAFIMPIAITVGEQVAHVTTGF